MPPVPTPSRRVVLGVAALVLALVLTGCGAGEGASGAGRITVYSGRTKELIDPLLQRFSQETGIAVDVRYGDSADLALQLETEGDQSPADVFLSQSPGALDFLSGQGRLVALPQATLDRVDARVRSPKGEWVGLSGRVRVLVYNTEQLAETQLPRSVFDLVRPEYKDKVAVAPTNGSFQDFVTSMRHAVGDDRALEWLRGMKDNGARTFANNTAIVQAVGRGELPLGLVNHYYNERAKAEDPGVKSANHAFADDDLGNLILVTGIATLSTAKDKALATRLIDHLLAAPAQEYFAKETFEYPVAAGVKPVVDLPPLTSIKAPQQDLSELGDLAQTARLIDQSGLNSG